MYWHWDFTYCYLLLNDQADPEALGQKMSQLRMDQFADDFGEWNDAIDFKLQALNDIHLFSRLKGELGINGAGLSVQFLMIIGVCILLMAYLNYVNLATVKAVERKTEIGIRKIVGSTKWQLTAQLLVESAMLNLIAVLLAVMIFVLCQPLFMNLTDIKFFYVTSMLITPGTLKWAGFTLAAGIFLSSIY